MLSEYVQLIKEGEVVAFPTETVYGLGADAWNPSAIQKVFKQKGRPADNPLIVHISSQEMVKNFVPSISSDAQKLMDHFWPGPLTLIFPKKPEVLDIITAGLDTVAIRWPKCPIAQEFISQTGPLVAPSANTSGKPSPTKAEHVKEDFGADFPVIEGGETDIGLESTVLDVTKLPFNIYRPGAISAGEIEEIVQSPVQPANQNTTDIKAKSPGTKYTHYAPKAAVRWLNEGEKFTNNDTLYLIHSKPVKISTPNVISYQNAYRRMAHELYDRFRQADQKGYKSIAIELFSDPEVDPLIPALKNRIEKAVSS